MSMSVGVSVYLFLGGNFTSPCGKITDCRIVEMKIKVTGITA